MQVHYAMVRMGIKNTSCIGSLLPLCSCCSTQCTPCYMACKLLASPISAFHLTEEHLQMRAKCMALHELWGTQVWVFVSFQSLSPITSLQLCCFSYLKSWGVCLPYLAYCTRYSLLEVDPCHCKQQSLSCLGVQVFPVPSALTFSGLWLQVCTTASGFSRWVLRIKLRRSCFCYKHFSNITISLSHWCCLVFWSVTMPFPIEFVLINNCTHGVL